MRLFTTACQHCFKIERFLSMGMFETIGSLLKGLSTHHVIFTRTNRRGTFHTHHYVILTYSHSQQRGNVTSVLICGVFTNPCSVRLHMMHAIL